MALSRKILAVSVFGLTLTWAVPAPRAQDKDSKDSKPPAAARKPLSPWAWTLEEALQQLEMNPQDAFLQFVVLQMARREHRLGEAAGKMRAILHGRRSRGPERYFGFSLDGEVETGQDLDLMSFFRSSPELQAGLQEDIMAGREPGRNMLSFKGSDFFQFQQELQKKFTEQGEYRHLLSHLGASPSLGFPGSHLWGGIIVNGNAGDFFPLYLRAAIHKKIKENRDNLVRQRKEILSLDTLPGLVIPRMPWDKLLQKKNPPVSRLSRCVPPEFYLAEFRTPAKLREILSFASGWARYWLIQTMYQAQEHPLEDVLQEQLLLSNGQNPLLELAGGLVIDELAVAGSNLSFQEGSDFTLLLHLKETKLFRTRMDALLARAIKDRPGVKHGRGKFLDVEYDHVATPDRRVCVYAAYPAPDLHVRSNSKFALERIIEAIRGKKSDGKPAPSLGESAEFKYFRNVFPHQAAAEDGFIYLSDAFLRKFLGPENKIAHQRRLMCSAHLKIIDHAASLYQIEKGKRAKSLAELVKAGCLPSLKLACPDGGAFSLDDTGSRGLCSHHGHSHFLTPCCELPLQKINGLEVEDYNTYKGSFGAVKLFSPLAFRIKIDSGRCKLETFFRNNPEFKTYQEFAGAFGNPSHPLDPFPVPRGNLFTVATRLNKKTLLENVFARLDQGFPKLKVKEFIEKGLDEGGALHVYDWPIMFDFSLENFLQDMLKVIGLSKEPQELADFSFFNRSQFLSFLTMTPVLAPMYASVEVRDPKVVDDFLDRLEPVLARLARGKLPDTGFFLPFSQDFYRLTNKDSIKIRSYGFKVGPVTWRFYWARIGKALYVANQPFILDDIRTAARIPAGKTEPSGHLMMRLRPANWNKALPGFKLAWAESNRLACLNNLGPLSSTARAFSALHPPAKGSGSWDDRSDRAQEFAEKHHGKHFFCPEGGHYLLARDGKHMTCSVHGSPGDPQQPDAPHADSPLEQLLRRFGGLTASVTFRGDGIHAVLVIDRK